MLRGSQAFSGQNSSAIFSPMYFHLWRKLEHSKNKKVHKHLHLWPLGPHRRRLAVRSGTSKGSTISQYIRGISHRGPIERRRRRRRRTSSWSLFVRLILVFKVLLIRMRLINKAICLLYNTSSCLTF